MDAELIIVGIEFPKERVDEVHPKLLENQLELFDIRKQKLSRMDLHTAYFYTLPDGRLLIGYVQACADHEAGQKLPSPINMHSLYDFFWSHRTKLIAELIQKCEQMGLLHVFSGDQYGVFYVHIQE